MCASLARRRERDLRPPVRTRSSTARAGREERGVRERGRGQRWLAPVARVEKAPSNRHIYSMHRLRASLRLHAGSESRRRVSAVRGFCVRCGREIDTRTRCCWDRHHRSHDESPRARAHVEGKLDGPFAAQSEALVGISRDALFTGRGRTLFAALAVLSSRMRSPCRRRRVRAPPRALPRPIPPRAGTPASDPDSTLDQPLDSPSLPSPSQRAQTHRRRGGRGASTSSVPR